MVITAVPSAVGVRKVGLTSQVLAGPLNMPGKQFRLRNAVARVVQPPAVHRVVLPVAPPAAPQAVQAPRPAHHQVLMAVAVPVTGFLNGIQRAFTPEHSKWFITELFMKRNGGRKATTLEVQVSGACGSQWVHVLAVAHRLRPAAQVLPAAVHHPAHLLTVAAVVTVAA